MYINRILTLAISNKKISVFILINFILSIIGALTRHDFIMIQNLITIDVWVGYFLFELAIFLFLVVIPHVWLMYYLLVWYRGGWGYSQLAVICTVVFLGCVYFLYAKYHLIDFVKIPKIAIAPSVSPAEIPLNVVEEQNSVDSIDKVKTARLTLLTICLIVEVGFIISKFWSDGISW